MKGTMIVLRPSTGSCVIFGVIGAVIFLPGLDAVWLGQWQGMVPMLMGATIALAPIMRYRISWDSDTLVYRGLIRTQQIRLSDIKKFNIRVAEYRSRLDPTVALYVYSSSTDPDLVINIKPFGRVGVAALIEKLKSVVKT